MEKTILSSEFFFFKLHQKASREKVLLTNRKQTNLGGNSGGPKPLLSDFAVRTNTGSHSRWEGKKWIRNDFPDFHCSPKLTCTTTQFSFWSRDLAHLVHLMFLPDLLQTGPKLSSQTTENHREQEHLQRMWQYRIE